MFLLFVITVTKYLNSATFSTDLLLVIAQTASTACWPIKCVL